MKIPCLAIHDGWKNENCGCDSDTWPGLTHGLLRAIDTTAVSSRLSLFIYPNGAGAFERTSEIASDFPSLLIELRNADVGFASSRNSALGELGSSFDLIIFLDDDIVPSDRSIALLMSAAEESGDQVLLSGFSHRIPEVPISFTRSIIRSSHAGTAWQPKLFTRLHARCEN